MSSNNRKEPFRYFFYTPPHCLLQIIEINGKELPSKYAPSSLIDLNKSGCRMKCDLNLKADVNRIKLNIIFDLIEEKLTVPGFIKWQRQNESSYYYGIQFELSPVHKEHMLKGLRSLSSMHKIKAM